MKKQIGKNTLGGGKKMSIDLKTYNRSTHNLSRIFRSSMSVGTLTPCFVDVAMPGDTWETKMNASVLTLPTVGPLFGTYKLQVDMFVCPIRLYIRDLHNNKLGVGLNMKEVKMPMFKAPIPEAGNEQTNFNPQSGTDFSQINPSCLLNYLGLKGWGTVSNTEKENIDRNAIPTFAYYDIFKNFYANTQEDDFYIVGKGNTNIGRQSSTLESFSGLVGTGWQTVFRKQGDESGLEEAYVSFIDQAGKWTRNEFENNIGIRQVNLETGSWEYKRIKDFIDIGFTVEPETYQGKTYYKLVKPQGVQITIPGKWQYQYFYQWQDISKAGVTLDAHKLEDIDTLRELLLTKKTVIVDETNTDGVPEFIHQLVQFDVTDSKLKTTSPMFGLCVKTHQSDIFNNWVNTEVIDGDNGINAITSVSTADGSFTIDSLNLAEKIYKMLMRVAVSGGTYKDYIEVSYDYDFHTQAETPIYEGGLSADIEFQEVVSTAATEDPLGTLAGRGKIANIRNGNINIKVHEPSFIIGIASITPYCDYSQGNEWFTKLSNMAEIHVPQLDGIGFQDLTQDKIAWWADPRISAGKQPAWIDYMTSYNHVHGNFAANQNNGFMVLNRIYESKNKTNAEGAADKKIISNMTTYINPEEFNYIFADADISAQNFWVQIGFMCHARRKMSAAQIPNL